MVGGAGLQWPKEDRDATGLRPHTGIWDSPRTKALLLNGIWDPTKMQQLSYEDEIQRRGRGLARNPVSGAALGPYFSRHLSVRLGEGVGDWC